MPKPMTMLIGIEEIAFGPVFRKLKNMPGVVSLDIMDDDDKPKGKKPDMRGKTAKGTDAAGSSTLCMIMDYIVSAKRACPTGELKLMIMEAGKAEQTFSTAAYKAKKDGLLTKTAKGWNITKKGRAYHQTECHIDA